MSEGDLQSRERLRDLAREFADRVIRPVARELDRKTDPEEGWSWEIIDRASEIGLRTLALSEAYGGAGLDSVTTAIVIEEIAKADVAVAGTFAQQMKLAPVLERFATESQRERYLTRFVDEPRFLLAIGITEPDVSSDYVIPYRGSDARFRTTATRAEGGWTLNGMKHFISLGNRAGLYFVLAQTDKDSSLAEGSTCFLVESGAPGFSIGRIHDKMGERLINNAELVFSSCFVPDEDVLGEVGGGFGIMGRFFRASNAYSAASVLGVGEAAYSLALEWTQTRVQGGRRLIEHDSVAIDLARMRMLLDAARSYVHHAAATADRAADDPATWDPTLSALPKVVTSQAVFEVVTSALELHGGYGYMRDLGIEKLFRDATAFLHSDGANRTLLLKAARFIREGLGVPTPADASPADHE